MIVLNTRLLTPLLTVAFSIAILICGVTMGVTGLWVPLAPVLLCLLVGRPKWLLTTYFLWVMVYEFVSFLFRGECVRWVDKGLTLLLLLVLVAHRIRSSSGFERFRILEAAAGVLLALTIASGVANLAPALGAAHFVLSYFRFFLIFACARHFLTDRDSRFIYYLMGACLLFQLAINVGWQLGINPIPNFRAGSVDFAIGTLQGCDLVSYFAIACATLFVVGFFNSRRPLWKFVNLIMVLLAVYQVWISYTVHAYALLVVSLGILLLLPFRDPKKRLWLGATALTILLVSCLPQLPGIGTGTRSRSALGYLTDNFNARNMRQRWERMIRGSKGQAYRDVCYHSTWELHCPWLGAGPGNFASAVGRHYRRPLAEKYINYVISAPTTQRYIQLSEGSSVTGHTDSGFLAIWSELGPLGALLYWGLHVYAAARVLRLIRRGVLPDDFHQRILAEAFVPTMAVWVIINLLVDVAYNPFLAGGLWAWAGMVWGARPSRTGPESRSAAPADSGDQGRFPVPAQS
ncbi:MAG: hypothetical protein QME60_00810 [Verrucomicrobiota bacterium]|nr:hypothetical protein [Verrucomicrobiota bacterium]